MSRRVIVGHEVSIVITRPKDPTDDLVTMGAIREWLLENVGEERPSHPMNEYEMDGYLDYFEGEWAYREGVRDDPPHTHRFWFWDHRKATLFALRWKGST